MIGSAEEKERLVVGVATAVLVPVLLLGGCIGEVRDFWAGLEPDASWDTGADADADGDTDADADADADGDGDTDGDGDSDADGDSDTVSETGGCQDTGEDTGSGASDADTDADADADADGDADADADADTDTDTDADADTDTDADSDTGSGIAPSCPGDMVLVPAHAALGVAEPFCLDRYEASRDDATAFSQGSEIGVARSVAGVLPWSVNPMSEAHLATFEAACLAAGKHLCTDQEWYLSCTGTAHTTYSWGDAFDREVCNCVDTYCDDYCATEGIPPEECYQAGDCGYHCGPRCPGAYCPDATCPSAYYEYCSTGAWCHQVRPAGSLEDCVDEFGARDVNGNVWEIVASADDPYGRPYEIRGGAFNCASASARLACTFNASWTALHAGFRCCREPD